MARRKGRRAEEPEEEREEPEEPEGQEEELDPFTEALDSVMGIEEARVDVYRRGPQGPEFCGKIQPDEFSLDLVQKQFGGGRFDLRILKGSRWVKGKTVAIAGPILNLSARMAPEDGRGREERREAEEDARRAKLETLSAADALQELRRDFRDLLAAVRNPPPAAYGGDPLTMAMELQRNFVAMMAPYVDRAQGDRDPDSIVELIRLGMDLAESRGGQKDPYAMVLTQALPMLNKLLTSGPAGGVPTPEAPPPMPEPTTALEALRPWVPTLIHWAARATDPRLRADFIIDEIPERFSEMLSQFVSGPEALTSFLTAFPEGMTYREWFEGLFHGLRVAYGYATDEEDPGTPAVELGGPDT